MLQHQVKIFEIMGFYPVKDNGVQSWLFLIPEHQALRGRQRQEKNRILCQFAADVFRDALH